jgi:NTE family protein
MAANVVEAKTWLDDDDLFLRPDPVGIETLDFNQLGEAERRGREAAEALAPVLRSLSVSEEEYARHLAKVRRSKAAFTRPMVIDRIAVSGNQRVHDEIVLHRLHTVTGQPLDLAVLQEDLNRVYRMGEFSRVSYDIDYVPTDDGVTETVLVILTVEQERGPGVLRAGARIEGDLSGEAGFMVNFMYRRSFIHRYRAEWRTFLSLGDLLEIDSEFFQYLGAAEHWFVAPSARYLSDEGTSYLSASDKVVVDGWAGWGRLDLGFEAGNNLQARAGAFAGKLKTELNGAADADLLDVDLGMWSLGVIYDGLDVTSFPSRGGYTSLYLDMSRPGLGATDRYDRLDWSGAKPLSWGRNTLLGSAEFGSDLGGGLPPYDKFHLGGPNRLSGYRLNQLRGDQKLLLKLRYYRRIFDLTGPIGEGIYAGVGAGAGAVLESGDTWTVDSLIPSASVFLGAETMIGPFNLGWGWAEVGHQTFYLTLGHIHRFDRL